MTSRPLKSACPFKVIFGFALKGFSKAPNEAIGLIVHLEHRLMELEHLYGSPKSISPTKQNTLLALRDPSFECRLIAAGLW